MSDATSSHCSSLVVNLLVGLCRGSRGVARTLHDIGYRDRWVTRAFREPGDELRSPAFCIASTAARHTVFVEARSGDDVDSARLSRYSGVTAADLRAATSLSRAETETWDVAVFGWAARGPALEAGLADGGFRHPLLLLDDRGVSLAANRFVKPGLNNVFVPRLRVDWPSVPASWVPMDTDSTDARIAETVVPDVVARALRGQARIPLAELCRGQAAWSVSGTRERERMRRRVGEVLAKLVAGEFKGRFRLRGETLEAVGGRRALARMRSHPALRRLAIQYGAFLERAGVPNETGAPDEGDRAPGDDAREDAS